MVETSGSEWHESNRGFSLFLFVYLVLLIGVLKLSKMLHNRPKLGAILPEAAMVILVGIAVGTLVRVGIGGDEYSHIDDEQQAANGNNGGSEYRSNNVAASLLSFSPQVFFIVLLPPIIFNSGYHLRRDLFFRYITPICLYACLGTLICSMVNSLWLRLLAPTYSFTPTLIELMTYGALISSTDPVSTLAVFSAKKVDPHMFYLVFGDSTVNDAVCLVLFDSLSHLLDTYDPSDTDYTNEVWQFLFDFSTGFVGSVILGYLIGLGYGYFFKIFDFRQATLLELGAYITVMYLPFVVAEVLHLSGIVTVLLTGVAAKRYAEPNLSPNTMTSADLIFRLLSHLTETIIFLELGLSVPGLFGTGGFDTTFLIASLLGCLIGRAANVYPITLLYNTCHRRKHAPPKSPSKEAGLSSSVDYVAHDEELAKPSLTGTPMDDSKISWNKANMLWFSGLRGAVSYGLVRMFPETENKHVFVATTMVVVLLTTFVLGGATEWALNFWGIDVGVDEKQYLDSIGKKQLLQGKLSKFESNTLRGWVIRDFAKDPDDDQTEYMEHLEVTDEDHRQIIGHQGSVFDYGK